MIKSIIQIFRKLLYMYYDNRGSLEAKIRIKEKEYEDLKHDHMVALQDGDFSVVAFIQSRMQENRKAYSRLRRQAERRDNDGA